MNVDNQKPTFSAGLMPIAGEGVNAIEMATEYGYKPDPWQGMVLEQILTPDVYQVGFSCPRQNGKNGVLEIVELYCPVVNGLRILHTAHQMQTSIEQFHRLVARWFSNPVYPDLADCVTVSYGRGSEELVFHNGGRVLFTTRSAVRGRGFAVDILVLDESQEMDEDEWAALVPTLTASPNAIIVMTGTPPVSTRQGQGVVFQRFRQKAYDSELNPGEVYVEWGVNDLETDEIGSVNTWERVNPAWHYRINKNIIRANSLVMDKESFAREHLGYWFKGVRNTAYKDDHWSAGIVETRPAPQDVARFAVGIVYAQDGESWAAAIGAVLGDGSYYAELIDLASTKKGTVQLLQIVSSFYAKDGFVGVLAFGKAGTLNLIGDAESCGLFPARLIEICRHNDKIASNALLDTLMGDGALKHVAQEPLRASLLSLDKYMVNSSGGGFSFVSRTGRLIASEAAALALYWAKNKQPKPKRPKQKVW